MKKTGIINAQLAGLIAGLGHSDLFMICDGGMPIPKGVTTVDLALCAGVPTFVQVFDAILEDVAVEHYTLANEIVAHNDFLLKHISTALKDVECEMIPHVEFKKLSATVKFAIRTGEFSYYPNVILKSGVVF